MHNTNFKKQKLFISQKDNDTYEERRKEKKRAKHNHTSDTYFEQTAEKNGVERFKLIDDMESFVTITNSD